MLKLNFNPNEKHIIDVKNWLFDEWNKTNSGFYCNWDTISDEFEDNNVSVITKNDKAIGFVVHRIHDLIAVIDIVEIKPSERKQGVAKKLINGVLDLFKQKGVLVTRLYCSPEDSEPFWRRIGFNNFPELPNDKKINMFKPLVETLNPKGKAKTNTTISLWNYEPYQADEISAKWHWDLNFLKDNKTLEKPIIFPVSSDWKIELIKNGQKIISNKVKRFPIDLADYGSFMIIREVIIKEIV